MWPFKMLWRMVRIFSGLCKTVTGHIEQLQCLSFATNNSAILSLPLIKKNIHKVAWSDLHIRQIQHHVIFFYLRLLERPGVLLQPKNFKWNGTVYLCCISDDSNRNSRVSANFVRRLHHVFVANSDSFKIIILQVFLVSSAIF